VDPNRTKAIGVSLIKNDRRDAVWLAKLASAGLLATVRVPSRKERIDRMPVVSRDALVRCRTRLLNAVRSLCASEGVILPACSATKVVELVEDGEDKFPDGLYEALRPLLDSVVGLSLSIEQGTAAVQARAKADPLLRRLQTVPGVGPITASVFAATIADPQRFRTGREVGAYLGLVPSLYQSGAVERRGRITKRGNRQARWTLTMAANALLCSKGDSALTRWAKQLEKRLGRKKACVAIARKLAAVLWAVWRTQTDFEPRLAN
jgi:transposase